jgi:hypothetical protein
MTAGFLPVGVDARGANVEAISFTPLFRSFPRAGALVEELADGTSACMRFHNDTCSARKSLLACMCANAVTGSRRLHCWAMGHGQWVVKDSLSISATATLYYALFRCNVNLGAKRRTFRGLLCRLSVASCRARRPRIWNPERAAGPQTPGQATAQHLDCVSVLNDSTHEMSLAVLAQALYHDSVTTTEAATQRTACT